MPKALKLHLCGCMVTRGWPPKINFGIWVTEIFNKKVLVYVGWIGFLVLDGVHEAK